MKYLPLTYTALVASALLAGCALNGLSQVPKVSKTNVQTIGKLEMAVGTANFGFESNVVGLNVVTSFRQADGDSAVLADTPTITGPSGFTNSGGSANPDLSTNAPSCADGVFYAGTDNATAKISGEAQNPDPYNTPTPPTFGQTGGVFGYGIQPLNSEANLTAQLYLGSLNGGACNTGLVYKAYPTPFYFPDAALATLDTNYGLTTPPVYIGGSPAYPFFRDGTYPSNYAGYSQGFDAFQVTPVAGTYTLDVNVAAANTTGASYSTTASLSNTTPLANYAAPPTWTSDTTGGGSGTVTVPSDSRITETLVYVYDETNGDYFTAGPLTGTGTLSYTIPDNLGNCAEEGSVGCENTYPESSMAANDKILVYAASYDYPMFESSPTVSTSQTPTIVGAEGQADVTFSPLILGTE